MTVLATELKDCMAFCWDSRHYSKYVGAGLLTAGVAAYLDFRRVQRDRVTRCVELSKDFTSSDFLPIRNRASFLLTRVYTQGIPEIEKNAPDDHDALTSLSGFYQHVGISFAENTVKRKLVLEYFGRNFVWWYVNFFSIPEGPIARGWGAGIPISQLYKNLKRRAHKGDWNKWHEAAEAERQARISSIENVNLPLSSAAKVRDGAGAAPPEP